MKEQDREVERRAKIVISRKNGRKWEPVEIEKCEEGEEKRCMGKS